MTDLVDQFEQDVENVVPADDAIKTIANLAQQQVWLERKLVEVEEFQKRLKDRLKKVAEYDLPNAMATAGVKVFVLEDGTKIEIKEEIYASIPKAREAEAFNWLRENGHGSIIKNVVACSFGRGQDEQAELFKQRAEEMGLQPEQKTSIHAATLKAFIKEQRGNGAQLPLEVLGAHIVNVAKIKLPK